MNSASKRDVIADYLFQKFILQNDDCARPKQIPDEPGVHHTIQSLLHRWQIIFKEQGPTLQKECLSQCAGLLIDVLNPNSKSSISDELLDKLSLKLEQNFTGQSKTLRPFLDVLVESGLYADPDLVPSLPSLGHPFDLTDSERAWKQEYQGSAHETLLRNIQTSFVACSNSGAIIQSSGYGKSRTVDQMATLIPTIPMNVRPRRAAGQGAFPPADTVLVEIFESMTMSQNPVQTLLVFFKQLFKLVRDLAKDFQGENFTLALYDSLNSQHKRAKFYSGLSLNQAQTKDENAAQEALASFRELAALFPKSTGGVQLVIYIDAAHYLASMTFRGVSMLDHMLKAAAKFGRVGVFFLFISTASTVANQPDSARFRLTHGDPVTPFTEMPFDCHPSLVKELIPSGMQLEEIQKFSFTVRFGRPLFWAYFEAVAKKSGHDSARLQVLDMAEGKLIASPSLSRVGNTGKLAILDTLLSLEYDLRSTHTRELESKMVESHLRTVYSMPASRAYMHTGYPSEPVLAEAALRAVDATRGTQEATCLGPLLSLYNDVESHIPGAIDRGERGENIGKLILLTAYIAAARKSGECQDYPPERLWGYGCSVVSFLTELTGKAFRHDVLVSVPDNAKGGAPLQETFANSWVRFTHFARGADDSAMTSEMAWIAFVRGMAMIGWRSQTAVDVSIPILLDKNKPIAEANMSSILVQFTAGYTRTSKVKAAVWEHEVGAGYFPPLNSSRNAFVNPQDSGYTAYHTRPYISLVMELALVAAPNSIPRKVAHHLDNPHRQVSASQINPQSLTSDVHIPSPPALLVSQQASSDLIHPRYSLFYYGFSHNVYQCIPDTHEARTVRETLLRLSTVFNDRLSTGRAIGPVLQMKPFWNAGPNCFSWVDAPYFKPVYRPLENKLGDALDEVLVGAVGDSGDHDEESDSMDESS